MGNPSLDRKALFLCHAGEILMACDVVLIVGRSKRRIQSPRHGHAATSSIQYLCTASLAQNSTIAGDPFSCYS